ncbi:polypyrimidine tract-binding protein homolog 2 isoform X1 [Tanacetum coccineum]
MFNVVKKLKNLKKPIRKLLYEKGNLHANVSRLRTKLDSFQSLLNMDPFNASLREEEALCVVEFNQAALMEERFLKQKAKINWLKEGDSNSAYFYKTVKSRVSRSCIDTITNAEGLVFVNEAVKEALFSMGDDKSPGPDGYTACFFKAAWEVVADDVTNAIRDKIIANRIKHSLKLLISPNQSAFVPGRNITDNILLTQELMHNYHLDRGTPRCSFKVDIQKAYDTVDWEFLRRILHGFGFPARMIAWIMECVTTTSYSICVNGSLHGYFRGKRGLRQGDPLSPYLFTLVMEVLTLMLQRRVHESQLFTYHMYCFKLELINLCFADDLFLFAYGDVHSASIIKETLDEFKGASGLTPSLPKSTAYFCNVLNHVKVSILQILPFEEGKLPVKYLGVPLVSSRLLIRDCVELLDRVQIRIQDWKNKSLSAASSID